jgi:kinesin family protein 1
MPLKIFGIGDGLCSEGNDALICPPLFGLFSHSDRPYLHVYKHSNEIEEVTVIGLEGVNVESNPEMESLLGVSTAYPSLRVFDIDVLPKRSFTFTLFTSANSHALAAPNLKELRAWITKLDPTRLPS